MWCTKPFVRMFCLAAVYLVSLLFAALIPTLVIFMKFLPLVHVNVTKLHTLHALQDCVVLIVNVIFKCIM